MSFTCPIISSARRTLEKSRNLTFQACEDTSQHTLGLCLNKPTQIDQKNLYPTKSMMTFRTLLLSLLVAAAFASCIGTDVIDDLADQMPPTELVPTDSMITERQGTLQGQGGYTATGTVTLRRNEAGDLILSTSADFEVSFAAGTFLYLSNSQDGRVTANDGLEVADVSTTTTGAQTFNVTQVNPDVTVSTYQYVIVLCKPARLTFGAAELN